MATHKDEYRAALDLILPHQLEEEGELLKMCGTCHFARARAKQFFLRCAKHDLRVRDDESCAEYVPAPEIEEAQAYGEFCRSLPPKS
jgi:hypothetical protein